MGVGFGRGRLQGERERQWPRLLWQCIIGGVSKECRMILGANGSRLEVTAIDLTVGRARG